MDLTSPEKRRVQKLRAGRRSPPPRRAIEDGDEEITRPDPPRPPAVRALSTGLNFKKAVRTVIQQNYGRGLSWYSLTRVDEDDASIAAVPARSAQTQALWQSPSDPTRSAIPTGSPASASGELASCQEMATGITREKRDADKLSNALKMVAKSRRKQIRPRRK